MSLHEHVVIVTGATGNVGAAVLEALASRGARIVAVDRHPERLRRAVAPLGAGAEILPVAVDDLAHSAECEAMAQRALDRFGRIDGLVHTVGAFAAAPLAEADPDLWERMFRLNLLTTLGAFRAVLPAMRRARRGGLVAIGAGAALRAPAGLAAYAASKSALLRLVESAAEELKAEGVRVNAVLPGTIDTPQNRAAMPGADHAAWATPQELAEAIAFLLSDAAGGITGASLPVTGRI